MELRAHNKLYSGGKTKKTFDYIYLRRFYEFYVMPMEFPTRRRY